MSNDSLGDRMKEYEGVPRTRLIPKVPVMIRLDGKAFHTFTRGMPRPYHRPFHECMWTAARYLCEHIQGCQLAYVQSDEITLLLLDTMSLEAEGWFGYEVQKMASIAAAMCTAAFNKALFSSTGFPDIDGPPMAAFDARVWNVPKEEVTNAFLWRQQDATRNAIQMVGQSKFSHKELHGVSCAQIQEKLFQEHGINFNDLPVPQKRGVCVVKEYYDSPVVNRDGSTEHLMCARRRWHIDENIPIFSQDRQYVERFLAPTSDA
jgi:tRNA(His) 5'-end guanylyltransferase